MRTQNKHTYTSTHSKTIYRQTDRQTDTHIDRQTDTHPGGTLALPVQNLRIKAFSVSFCCSTISQNHLTSGVSGPKGPCMCFFLFFVCVFFWVFFVYLCIRVFFFCMYMCAFVLYIRIWIYAYMHYHTRIRTSTHTHTCTHIN